MFWEGVMNGSLVPWRQKEHSALPGAAFFTDRLLGMGLSSPCSLKAFIQHQEQVNVTSSLPSEDRVFGEIDPPSQTKRKRISWFPSLKLRNLFLCGCPIINHPPTCQGVGHHLWFSPPHQHPCLVHCQPGWWPPHLQPIRSLSLRERHLSRLNSHSHLLSDLPLFTFALSPLTERSSRSVQIATLSCFDLRRPSSELRTIHIPLPGPTRPRGMWLLSFVLPWWLSSRDPTSSPAEWVTCHVPSKPVGRPPDVGIIKTCFVNLKVQHHVTSLPWTIGLLCFHSCFHGFQFRCISIFSLFGILYPFQVEGDLCTQVVLKAATRASRCSEDNSSAMECLTLGQYLFFPG